MRGDLTMAILTAWAASDWPEGGSTVQLAEHHQRWLLAQGLPAVSSKGAQRRVRIAGERGLIGGRRFCGEGWEWFRKQSAPSACSDSSHQ